MKIGETALVIRHTITLDGGETLVFYQHPSKCSINDWHLWIKNSKENDENPSIAFTDIHMEDHRFFLECVSRHSMKMVKVTLTKREENPFNENYGEDLT